MRDVTPELHFLSLLQLVFAEFFHTLQLLLLHAQVLLELVRTLINKGLVDLVFEHLARLLNPLLAIFLNLLLQLEKLAPPHRQFLLVGAMRCKVGSRLALSIKLITLYNGLLGQTVLVVLLLQWLHDHGLGIARQNKAALHTFINTLGGSWFSLEFYNAFAGGSTLVVHNDDRALHWAEHGKCLLQILVGHVWRQIFDANSRSVTRKTHANASTYKYSNEVYTKFKFMQKYASKVHVF